MPTLPAIVAPNAPAASPGLVPGAGAAAPGAGFGFEMLLALLLGVAPTTPAVADAPTAPATGQPADDGKESETASEAAGAVAAGALAAGAASATAADAGAAQTAGTATGGPPATPSTTTTAASAATTRAGTPTKADVAPITSEGGTLGSRAAAGVVVEENAGAPLPEQGASTGKGAASSAPSDPPSTTQGPTVAPAAPAASADVVGAALRQAEHPKADTPADGVSADRPHSVSALGGADAVALQTAHAGTHRDAGGDAHREDATPHAAPTDAPQPPTVPFHAPPRDAGHLDAARLEPAAPHAPEPPEPPHDAAPRSEMRLEVTSDDLGKVEVRVVVRADAVHATLLAPQDQAREVITQHRAALEEALGRAQLRLDGFTVGAGPNDGRQQHERFDRSGVPTATQAGVPLGLAATSAVTPVVAEATAGKGLSLRA